MKKHLNIAPIATLRLKLMQINHLNALFVKNLFCLVLLVMSNLNIKDVIGQKKIGAVDFLVRIMLNDLLKN
jgi:hypothetical protein